ncbi:MAG: hypothetical protein KBT27_11475 [Prevotellaceae bacterium]|nr:hypothetical protein [Candidatus Faecinaster equi]
MKIIVNNSNIVFAQQIEEPSNQYLWDVDKNNIDIPLSTTLNVGDNFDFWIKVDSLDTYSKIQVYLGNGKMSISQLGDHVEIGETIKDGNRWYHYKGDFYHSTSSATVKTVRLVSTASQRTKKISVFAKPIDFFLSL